MHSLVPKDSPESVYTLKETHLVPVFGTALKALTVNAEARIRAALVNLTIFSIYR